MMIIYQFSDTWQFSISQKKPIGGKSSDDFFPKYRECPRYDLLLSSTPCSSSDSSLESSERTVRELLYK